MPTRLRRALLAAVLPGCGLAVPEACELRREDAVEWDARSSQYHVAREGATFGFVVDADGKRVLRSEPPPWAKLKYVEDNKGHWVLEDGHFQVARFTDAVAMVRDPAVADARHEARMRGCWAAGGYTPDLCCSSGGWSECWVPPYSYETCCMGWAAHKDDPFLDSVRTAFTESHGILVSDSSNSVYYVHAILLGSLVAAAAGTGGRVMVEVGVDEGAFAVHILRELRRRGVTMDRYYAVDPWTGPHAYPGDRSMHAFLTATRGLAEFWPAPRVLQERGDLAAMLVANESADFVFVDAVHDFEHVSKHLELWWPKVKPGGMIAGHDYPPEKPGAWPGCVRAVQMFAARMGTATYLLGLPSTSFVMLKA
uniref:Methyltransferase domain-containing protein n=1 Tax=Alexandrium monilatum TaxID=311494 RepID=A0A7S4RA46_9DINO|mmetsp:Transcript_23745/g.74922  ORF Transcript_23745/g.74922 Transcript_23745/m.74922 type:complete len:367 (-) Transcript_23745:18-1118(-)